MKDSFTVTMFGDFSIRNHGISMTDKEQHSKKCLSLLEYLIANRNSLYSNNETMDLFWPENTSSNPLGVLKTLLHRTRNMLKKARISKGYDHSDQWHILSK